MLPADEGLDAHGEPGVEIDFGLVEDAQLAGIQRELQFVRAPGPLDVAHAGVVVEYHPTPATPLLRLVHGSVCVAQQRLCGRVRIRAQRDADAHAHRVRPCGDDNRLTDSGDNTRRELDSTRRIDALAQDRELVATQTGDRVARTQHALQPRRHRTQCLVSRRVAQLVVDHLESVEIQVQECQRLRVAPQTLHRLLDAVDQKCSLGKARELVVQREVRQRRFGHLVVGDVLADAGQHRRTSLAEHHAAAAPQPAGLPVRPHDAKETVEPCTGRDRLSDLRPGLLAVVVVDVLQVRIERGGDVRLVDAEDLREVRGPGNTIVDRIPRPRPQIRDLLYLTRPRVDVAQGSQRHVDAAATCSGTCGAMAAKATGRALR